MWKQQTVSGRKLEPHTTTAAQSMFHRCTVLHRQTRNCSVQPQEWAAAEKTGPPLCFHFPSTNPSFRPFPHAVVLRGSQIIVSSAI